MSSARRSLFFAVVAFANALVACSLFTSLDGLQNGDTDASAFDATSDASSDAITKSDSPSESEAGSDGGCPSAHGPTMVMITDVTPSFCIDSTEVTNAQYRDFLQANVQLTGQPSPECDGNASYLPQDSTGTTTLWPLASSLDPNPVANVDWCDAYAFCKWAGKHLCGAIGGGPGKVADHGDANKSQWDRACSKNGAQIYPFGSSYLPLACNGRDLSDGGASVPAASLSTCVGGYPGIFDMAGNVEERVDECDDAGCLSLGGSFVDYGPSTVEMCTDTSEHAPRDGRSGDIGFRCCAF